MLSSGNGTPQQCAQNLMSIIQGEAPYERCKGLDADITDRPAMEASGIIASEINWTLTNYEPRVSGEIVRVITDNILSGTFETRTQINTGGGT